MQERSITSSNEVEKTTLIKDYSLESARTRQDESYEQDEGLY